MSGERISPLLFVAMIGIGGGIFPRTRPKGGGCRGIVGLMLGCRGIAAPGCMLAPP